MISLFAFQSDEVFDLLCENFNFPKASRLFSRKLVSGVCENKEVLGEVINEASEHWRLERMARLDRTILRLAVFELMFMADIPPKVSMNEAVELGKKFGSEESGSFINGVIDNIYNQLLKQGRLKKEDGF